MYTVTLGSEDLGGNLKTSRGANTLIALNCVSCQLAAAVVFTFGGI